MRAALIAAATELIREHGAAGFSLREAARRVGVDAAACYRHFRDRQEVLAAIAQSGFAKLAQAFADDRARVGEQRPRQLALALGRTYLGFALQRPAEFKVMFGESGWSARDPRLRLPEVKVTAYQQLEQVARAYLEQHPLALEPATLANLLWAVGHGISRLMIDGAIPLEEPQAYQLLELSVDTLLGGLTKPRRTDQKR